MSRCPVSGTTPAKPTEYDGGYWYDGGFHHCACGAVAPWLDRPWEGGVVADHDGPSAPTSLTAEAIAELFCQDCTRLTYTTDIYNAWGWTLDSCTLEEALTATTLAELEPLAIAAARAIQDAPNADLR